MKSFATAAVLALAVASTAFGQLEHRGPANAIALGQTALPYDVVSIRIHDPAKDPPNQQSSSISIHDNIFSATNVPLVMVMEGAYDIKSDQISGLAGPVSSTHFDIEAKVLPPADGMPPKLTDAQLTAKIVPLLADRFKLRVHLQAKILPVYDLVVAKGGPKFKLSQEKRNDSSINMNGQDTNKVLTATSASMGDLAQALAGDVHRNVIDKTRLAGSGDITLKWSDDIAAEIGGPNVISIFTAVEEQLGLKLQTSKGPVDTLVVDHVEMPSEN